MRSALNVVEGVDVVQIQDYVVNVRIAVGLSGAVWECL